MKIILVSNAVRALLTLGAAAVLSACAPTPHVVPGAVYNRYPPAGIIKPPPVKPSVPAQRPLIPSPITLPLPQEKAPAVESIPLEAPRSLPPKQYVSSSAVRSLRQQAQTETGQGNVADAVATIERALRIEPENPDLWLVLSDLYKQQGNVQQAASMAAKAQYYQELLH
jgi:hypothetical protein